MELLNRSNAPFGQLIWDEIDTTMGEFLSKRLNLRSVVDFKDEYTFDTDGVSTKKIKEISNENNLSVSIRQPIKMVEIRKTFSLSKKVIEDIKRGLSDYDDSAFTQAANDFSKIENLMILNGFSEANISGILNDEIKHIEVNSTKDILAGVAKAMGIFNKEFVNGSFKLIVSSETLAKLYTEFFDGISVKTKLDDILGANEILVNENIGNDKALIVSQRSGDFEFYSGLDASIGFEKNKEDEVELFLIQTCAFRVISPEAAIVLDLK